MTQAQLDDDYKELIAESDRKRELADRIWNKMGHDITRLSPELQKELANYRRILLAMHTTPYAENECVMKCVKIGIEHDGLPSTFVVDRLNEILKGE